MNRQVYRWLTTIAGIWVLLFIFGCASSSKQKWLTFFFDGVPGSKPESDALVGDEVPAPKLDATGNLVIPDESGPARVVVSIHPPFENGECIECHASQFSQAMKEPTPGLCFQCHDDFAEQSKVVHQADCTSCHQPHDSAKEKLLTRTGRDLCLECHDDPVGNEKRANEPDITEFLGKLPKLVTTPVKKINHAPVESGCMDCHSPHASDTKGLLLKPVAETCAECHDDPVGSAKFKHDPAANGECMSCHAPHQSEFAGLLIKPGSAICFECHEEADIKKVKVHERFPDRGCTSCHDPHGSGEEKFLKAGVTKLITAPAKDEPEAP